MASLLLIFLTIALSFNKKLQFNVLVFLISVSTYKTEIAKIN